MERSGRTTYAHPGAGTHPIVEVGRAEAVALDGERERLRAGDRGGGVGAADLATVDLHDERAEQREALRSGEIALGYGFHRPDDPALASAVIARNRLGAVLAHDHPLAARDVLRVEDFHEQVVLLQPWILNPRPHDDLLATVRARGVHPDIRTHVTDLEAIITLVAAGDGLTFLPETHAANLALGPAVWRPVADIHHETHEVVLWRTANAGSPLLRPLLDVVRDMTLNGLEGD
ncbi:hypothetical protein GUY59_01035 [Nonomuraea sp. K271]|nr:hypothetical protein [Nonomuraea sp. K271]